MKRLSTVLSALCLVVTAQAQILPGASPEADSAAFARIRERLDSIRQYRPTVALVLSGGGARGLAHLGVIRMVEECGIPVDVVLGTSMGGMLAGFYSLGYNHSQMDSLVRSIEWPVMMSDKIPDAYLTYRLRKYRERFALRVPFHYDSDDLLDKKRRELSSQIEALASENGTSTSDVLQEAISRMGIGMPDGLLYGINIRNTISSVSVGYQDSLCFADLPVPYACVATEMSSMRPKYWTSGNVGDAIRSTIAIPFYFRAVRKNGEVLLDGGMRDNFPVDLAREIGADIIIGSEMSTRRSVDELNNPLDFVLQTINLLGIQTLEKTIDMPDLRVHHGLHQFNMLSFDEKSVDAILEEGYKAALENREGFEKIAAMVGKSDTPGVARHKTATNIALQKVKVRGVSFTGISAGDQRHLLADYLFPRDSLFGRDQVETMLNSIYGTGAFESVTYRLEGGCEPYQLVFDCQKGQVNDAAVGIHADTDEYVYAVVHLGMGTRRLSGFRFTTDLKLGVNPELNLDAAYRPGINLPTIGVSLRNHLLNTRIFDGIFPVSEKLFSMAADAYVEDSRMSFGSLRAGVTYEMAPYEDYLTVDQIWGGGAWSIDWKKYWVSAFGKIRIDTFDDGYFPTSGVQFVLDGRYTFKGYDTNILNKEMADTAEVPGYASVYSSLSAAFSPAPWFTVQPSLYAGWNSTNTNFMFLKHTVGAGGTLAGRYVEHQMPFFGFAAGFEVCRTFSGVAQLDLRFRVADKNFITARAGTFQDALDFHEFFMTLPASWAVGAEYARQTIVGPLKAGAQWCSTRGFSVSASIGFDF